MDVYVDMLFLVNGGMDALCLCLTARMLHRSLPLWRLASAAVMGGVYGVLALFIEVAAPAALVIDVAVCLAMCCMAFGRRRLWLTGGLYLLVSMVMGGVMTALYHWLNRAGAAALLPSGEEGLSSIAFLLLAMIGGGVTFLWGRVFRKAESRRETAVTLSITYGGKTVTLSGMIDSGNLLTDPVGGLPVIAVKREAVESLWSPSLKAFLAAPALTAESLSHIPEGRRLRLIPTDTATGAGLLVAVLPDEITLAEVGKNAPPHRVSALISPVPLAGSPSEAMVPSALLL